MCLKFGIVGGDARQALLAGLTEIQIGMQDTNGNDVEVTVLGRH